MVCFVLLYLLYCVLYIHMLHYSFVVIQVLKEKVNVLGSYCYGLFLYDSAF